MISDLAICDLLIRLYSWKGQIGPGWFENGDMGSGDHGVCWASNRVDGVDVILLRGSTTFIDWLRDFYAFTLPYSHAVFGPVHPGFYIGLPETLDNIIRATEGPWIVAGHSLGAGRACILTALMIQAGRALVRRVCFGSPKPGFQRLATYINSVPAASYRNGDARSVDEVTAVPLSFPPEMYVHPGGLIDVSAAPGSAGPQPDWGVLNWHHLPLYRAALAKMAA